MKRTIQSLVVMLSLAGLAFVVSGCSEIEPVSMDSTNETESPATRANYPGQGATTEFILPTGVSFGDLPPAIMTYLSLVEIEGQASPASGTFVIYYLNYNPAASGLEFTGWDISPNTYSTPSNPWIRPAYETEIKFNAPGTYTITANIKMLYNGKIVKLVRKVNVSTPPPTVFVSADKQLVTEGSSVTFMADVSSSMPVSVASYQWEMNGIATPGGATYTVTAPSTAIKTRALQPGPGTTIVSMRCRALIGTTYTEWSNMVSVSIVPQ